MKFVRIINLFTRVMSTYSWSPQTMTKSPYAVVVLNRPITIPKFDTLWNQAAVRISVDGGTNRLYELNSKLQNLRKPDLITGDFDSINEDVSKYYERQNVKILHTPDQNFTDFTKALAALDERITSGEFPAVKSVIAIADAGGRVDQAFANISTLFETNLNVCLSSEDSITWLMRTGIHNITLSPEYVASRPHCGLIPICGITKIKTKGLEWNLDGDYHFHGIVSTCNCIIENTVQVETEGDILWTMDRCDDFNYN